MAIQLNDNLKISAPKPIDERSQVFADLATAYTQIPLSERYRGLKFKVADGSSNVIEYQWKGIDLSDGAEIEISSTSKGSLYESIAYISPFGDDSTAELNNPAKPYATYGAVRTEILGENIVAEQVSVSFTTAANITENNYFWLFSDDTSYYFWFDKGTGSDPAPSPPANSPSTVVGTVLDISAATTESDIAAVAQTEIDGIADFTATQTLGQIDITLTPVGPIKNGDPGNSNVAVSVTVEGQKPISLAYFLAGDYDQRIDLESVIHIYAEDGVKNTMTSNRIFTDESSIYKGVYKIMGYGEYVVTDFSRINNYSSVNLRYAQSNLRVLEAKKLCFMDYYGGYNRNNKNEVLKISNCNFLESASRATERQQHLIYENCTFEQGHNYALFLLRMYVQYNNCTFVLPSQDVNGNPYTYDQSDLDSPNLTKNRQPDESNCQNLAAFCLGPGEFLAGTEPIFDIKLELNNCVFKIEADYGAGVKIIGRGDSVWHSNGISSPTRTFNEDYVQFNNCFVEMTETFSNAKSIVYAWNPNTSTTFGGYGVAPRVFSQGCFSNGIPEYIPTISGYEPFPNLNNKEPFFLNTLNGDFITNLTAGNNTFPFRNSKSPEHVKVYEEVSTDIYRLIDVGVTINYANREVTINSTTSYTNAKIVFI